MWITCQKSKKVAQSIENTNFDKIKQIILFYLNTNKNFKNTIYQQKVLTNVEKLLINRILLLINC